MAIEEIRANEETTLTGGIEQRTNPGEEIVQFIAKPSINKRDQIETFNFII